MAKAKTISIFEKENLRNWLLVQPHTDVVAKLMYVLTPEQLLLLIKLHGIKKQMLTVDNSVIGEFKAVKQKTKRKQNGKKKSATSRVKKSGRGKGK